MTQTIDLNHVVLQYAKRVAEYQRANPDVGMGPQPQWILDQSLEELKIPKSSIDYELTSSQLSVFCRKLW